MQDHANLTDQELPKESVQVEPQVKVSSNLVQDVSSSSAPSPTAKGMMLELCAGSAMLSKCFHEQGFTVMPVDHQQNRFHPLSKICNLSLTLESSWKYLHWLVATFTVMFCHAAPPCGTCSRARELPGGPPQLRNEVYPWGFDDLTPDQAARVEAANQIYKGLAVFIELLISLNIYFAVENPANSLLWLLPIWDTVLQHAFFVTFDACVYGGARKTAKTFLTNVHTLKAMAQRCNGGHTHLPFGRQKLPSGKYAYCLVGEGSCFGFRILSLQKLFWKSCLNHILISGEDVEDETRTCVVHLWGVLHKRCLLGEGDVGGSPF